MNAPFSRVLIGLALGLALGLVYGWLIRPVEYIDTTPDSLSADYRADYVLMVSEAFSSDGDLQQAEVRLAALGPEPPADMVAQAIEYAVDQGFRRGDLDLLNQLLIALNAVPPTAEIEGP